MEKYNSGVHLSYLTPYVYKLLDYTYKCKYVIVHYLFYEEYTQSIPKSVISSNQRCTSGFHFIINLKYAHINIYLQKYQWANKLI